MVGLSCPSAEETLIASDRCKEELVLSQPKACDSRNLKVKKTTGKGLWWALLQVLLTYKKSLLHTLVLLWASIWKSEAEQQNKWDYQAKAQMDASPSLPDILKEDGGDTGVESKRQVYVSSTNTRIRCLG